MKNNDILLYGGIAVAAYLLFFNRSAAPASAAALPVGVQPVKPVQTYLPTQPNVATSVLTAITALAPSAIKLLTNGGTQSPGGAATNTFNGPQIPDGTTTNSSIQNINNQISPPFLDNTLPGGDVSSYLSNGMISGPSMNRMTAAAKGLY